MKCSGTLVDFDIRQLGLFQYIHVDLGCWGWNNVVHTGNGISERDDCPRDVSYYLNEMWAKRRMLHGDRWWQTKYNA